MARMPTERDYITAGLPPEMAAGSDDPTQDHADDFTVQNEPGLTRVRIPTPASFAAHPPAANPAISAAELLAKVRAEQQQLGLLGVNPTIANPPLTFDFPLLPDVQFRGVLVGPAKAGHVKQLARWFAIIAEEMEGQETKGSRRK